MASSKYKGFLRKKLNTELGMVVSNLRKENAYLKKTLVDLSRQHSEHYKLVEMFLCIETVRLENFKLKTSKDKMALPSEQLSEGASSLTDVVNMQRQRIISTCAKEIEEIKNKLVNVSTKCQHIKKKVARKKALEKTKQWLEYDQQREAYVREILSRLLWLEKRLNEANQASSQQHNEDHSDEKMRQMQEHYERLLQKAKDELELLREKVDMSHQNLLKSQNWCKEREREVEELKLQLNIEKACKQSGTKGHHYSENEEQQPKDLQCRLDEEKLRSASFELQTHLVQEFLVNLHLADQDKIAELERQIKISLQDLEDEKQNCSYLTKQTIKILKMLRKPKDQVTKESEKEQQDRVSCAVTHPPSQLSRQSPTFSTHSSLLDKSFLECPGCQAEYPASHYRELMNHLEICLN
ncbi:Centrosomal protein of 55 kDa [Channa argus]|uniref:Centrosomal protein of 55 kDa n=1 Tax=Channa argus TaxID=215402 RepID=A0A6G1R0C8_CHAAH|nr:Centrosomal protein of 55 kDa [Channa argus]